MGLDDIELAVEFPNKLNLEVLIWIEDLPVFIEVGSSQSVLGILLDPNDFVEVVGCNPHSWVAPSVMLGNRVQFDSHNQPPSSREH